MAQQTQQSQQDMELVGTLLYQLKLESTSLVNTIMESANDNVRDELTDILNQSLQNQRDVFDFMNQQGWYKVEEAPQDQYQRVQQTFTTMRQASTIT